MWACLLTRMQMFVEENLIIQLLIAAAGKAQICHRFLWHLKSSFHTLLQTGKKCKQRSVDLIRKGLYGGIHMSWFWKTSCVWWLCSTKRWKHLCGLEQIMQSTSFQHSAGIFFSYHLWAYHIPSEDFPGNFFNPLQLIASRLRSPII